MFKEKFIQGNISKGRTIKPVGIVLHHTGDYPESSIVNTFTNRNSKASAHVLILKNGDRIIFAKDTERTWHAGVSEFKGYKYCNNFMLGAEFQGDTNKEPLTKEQIGSFMDWLIPRIKKHKLTYDYITDHRTVSPGRKTDLKPEEFNKVKSAIKYLFE